MKALDIKEVSKYIIMFVIMGIFFVIPPFEPLTAKGMQYIGIFLACLFGWSALNTTIVSVLGLVALCFAEGMTMAGVLAGSFGQPNVMLMILLFIFVDICRRENLAEWIAGFILSRPFLKGKPIMFSAAILVVTTILGIIQSFLALLLMWNVVYAICNEFNIKPKDKYSIVMLVGVALFASIGLVTLPFQDSGLILTGLYWSMTGTAINYLHYLLVMLPIQGALIALWILGSKYILHVDFDRLANVDKTDMYQKITKRQTACLWLIALLVALFLFTNNAPAEWAITQLLQRMTVFGLSFIVLFVASIWYVDGKPMLNFPESARDGILWNIMFLVAIMMFFASNLCAADTGVTALIIQYLAPVLNNLSPWVFMMLVLFVTFVLTNLINNIVVGSVMISILVPLAAVIDFNLPAVVTLIILICSYAMLTPASCGTSPLVYGNSEWIDIPTMYKCIIPLMVIGLIFTLTIGLAWAVFIF